MKKLSYLLSVMMIVVTFVNCDGKPEGPTVPAAESIEGYVTDEQGNALEGILVEIFLDEELKTPFDLLYYGINEKGEFELLESDVKALLTKEDGRYTQGQASSWKKGDLYEKDIYVVATDPAEVYASQMKKGQLVYDRESKVGEGRIDLVLSKK